MFNSPDLICRSLPQKCPKWHDASAGSDDPSKDRIKQLESSQHSLQQHVADLEAEWKTCSSALQEEQAAKLKAQEKSDKLAAAKKRLEQTVDDLQQQISFLEVRSLSSILSHKCCVGVSAQTLDMLNIAEKI